MIPLQTRRRHHRAHTNIYSLLDENEKDQEKIVAIYKNNEELKKHKRKRYTIEDQENTMGKSNQLTQIQRKKYEIKNDRKKKKQKGELRTE